MTKPQPRWRPMCGTRVSLFAGANAKSVSKAYLKVLRELQRLALII